MNKFILIFFLLFSTHSLANNTNIAFDVDILMDCEFEKVIINNSEYNYETLFPNQIKRNNLKSLRFKSKKPDILKVRKLSEFLNKTDLNLKIVNKDIILIRAFNKKTNYSESAVFTKKTGELIHEITRNIDLEEKEKEKDISFYKCQIINDKI